MTHTMIEFPEFRLPAGCVLTDAPAYWRNPDDPFARMETVEVTTKPGDRLAGLLFV